MKAGDCELHEVQQRTNKVHSLVRKQACKISHWMDSGHATDDKQDWFLTFITQTNSDNIVMWATRLNIHCRLELFQDSDFAGDLEDSTSTSGGVLCIVWKSNICADQLDVQEAEVSISQLHRTRDHIVGCWFAQWMVYLRSTYGIWSLKCWGTTQRIPKTNPSMHTGKPVLRPKAHPRWNKCWIKMWSYRTWIKFPSNAHLSEKESQLYMSKDNDAVIKMIIKGRSPTAPTELLWTRSFDRINPGPQKSKSSVSNPKTNSQTFLTKKAVSRVMGGKTCCICLTSWTDTTFFLRPLFQQPSFSFPQERNLKCRKDFRNALRLDHQRREQKHYVSFRDTAYLWGQDYSSNPNKSPGEYERLSSADMGRKEVRNPDGILFSMPRGNREYGSEDSGGFPERRKPPETESTREKSFKT